MTIHQNSAYGINREPVYERQVPYLYDTSYENGNSDSQILISRNSVYMPDDDELVLRNPWSRMYNRYYGRSVLNPSYYPSTQPTYALRRNEVRYVAYPSEKRTIPIELQKAFFAHGIVGR